MAIQWFYQTGGQQFSGPVDSTELRRLAEAGTVKPDTLVRQGDSARWVRAEQVRGLFQRSTPAPSLGATLPGPPPLPPPVARVSTSSGESPIRHGLGAAAVNEASEKPKRFWPVTGAAIIVGSGTMLLLLWALVWALVFRGGSAPPSAPLSGETGVGVRKVPQQSGGSAPPSAPLSGKTLDSVTLYANCRAAVATILTKDDEGFDAGLGSGFFIARELVGTRFARHTATEPRGRDQCVYLLTNYHVIRSAATADVQLDDGRRGFILDVVMEQEDVDLAVLLVGIPGPDRSSEPTKPIGTLQIAEGQEPPVGQKVYAIGSPQGLEASLSEGMISGRRQEANGPPWLQFTAPVSPGSSGGPLLDATGQVVGVVTAIRRGGQNLNRAVPTSEVIKFLAGPLNSRKLWRGTGIEEADDAYFSARSDAWDAALAKGVEGIEGSGGALLYTADQQIRQQDYSGAMESLAAIVPAQCGRFEFLWHYTIGRAAERRGIKRLGIDDDIVVPDEKYYGQVRMDKDCQLAKEEFRRSIELKPEFCPAYQRLARCLWREGGIGEAFASADWLVRKAPRCTTAYKLRGELNLALKRNRDALADFETAADLGPNSPHTWFSIGKTYSDLGEYEKAIAGYDNAIRLGHTQEGLCQFLVGFEYWDLSKYEQAIARFERARSLGYEPGKCDECIAKCRAAMK